MEKELKHIRKTLFDKLLCLDAPKSIFEFQIELAEELKRCERLQKSKKNESIKSHMHLLRCYGDSLAWQLLHPHAIRQLCKSQKNKSFLIDQEKGFNKTVEIAKGISEYDFPLIIADLTHCIRIGDIIICSDPEIPGIYECKSRRTNEKFELQGRRGRQLSRMKGTYKYLEKGHAKVFGEELTRVCIEIDSPTCYNWDIINDVLIKADNKGHAVWKVSDYEIIGATYNDNDNLFESLNVEEFKFKNVFFDTHYRAIREASPTVPPPINWKIEDKFKLQLMEGELFLIHIFDPNVFIGLSDDNARIISFSSKIPTNCISSGIADFAFEVDIKGHKIILSSNFAKQVLYGFETVESVAEQMLEFAAKSDEYMEKYFNDNQK